MGDTRLRVCQVIDSLKVSHGGPSECAVQVNAALRDRGIDITLHTVRSAEAMATRPGARIEAASSQLRLVLALPRHVRDSNLVHVHGFYGVVPLLACLLARLLRRPYVIHAHGVFEPYEWSRGLTKRRLFNAAGGSYAVAHVARVLVDTPAERDVARWPGVEPAVDVIPLGGSGPRSEVDRTPRSVLFLSRIAAKKRVDLVLAAWPEVVAKFPDAMLTIAGGDDEGLLAGALVPHPSITVAGQVAGPAKDAALAAADVFVLPSENENFGIAVAEAAAAGLCLLLSNNVALTAPLVAADAAVAFERLDADAVAAAIVDALASPARTEALRRNAVTYAEAHFSWGAVADVLAETYAAVAA